MGIGPFKLQSLNMAPIDKLHHILVRTSYWSAIVTITLCTIFGLVIDVE